MALTLIVVLLALVVLDLAALRFGHDSRAAMDERRNWW
jgi:hypothetical protein